jgi:hypothetical protein
MLILKSRKSRWWNHCENVSAMTQWSCVYHRAIPNGTSLYKYWTTPIHFAT